MNISKKKIYIAYRHRQKSKKKFLYFLDLTFDKKRLKDFIVWFTFFYGEKESFSLLEAFKVFGYKKATEAGISLNFEDLENHAISELKKPIEFYKYFKYSRKVRIS
jgi:hypothetical protein